MIAGYPPGVAGPRVSMHRAPRLDLDAAGGGGRVRWEPTGRPSTWPGRDFRASPVLDLPAPGVALDPRLVSSPGISGILGQQRCKRGGLVGQPRGDWLDRPAGVELAVRRRCHVRVPVPAGGVVRSSDGVR